MMESAYGVAHVSICADTVAVSPLKKRRNSCVCTASESPREAAMASL